MSEMWPRWRPTPWGLHHLARASTILNRKTGERAPWAPYREQIELWELLWRHRYLLIAKPRKTGISTGTEHDDLHTTKGADKAGNRFRCVFAIDEDSKAGEHLDQLEDFATQLRMPGLRFIRSKGSYEARFANGSKIECITAAGFNVGRGGTIHRLHCTELPYWRGPRKAYQNLRSSCADNAQIVIETTMDTVDPDGFVEKLWDDAKHKRNEFHAHFWSVQSHESYRMDPKLLTEEEWASCMREGFTDRASAAWWMRHALVNLAGNDMMKLMHDFPQKDEHLFAVGTGRVIVVTPPPLVVVKHLTVPGIFGDAWNVQLYGEEVFDPRTSRVRIMPIDHSGQVVISADTAMGRHKTNSVVLAQDKRDRRPLAGFWSNTVRYDDMGSIIANMRNHFTTKELPHDVEIVVEDDGVGDATCERLDRLHIPYHRFSQTGSGAEDKGARRVANQERCITATKRRVESGMRGAPQILREEVKRFRKNDKGDYEGPKDCIMTMGIGLVWMSEHAFKPGIDPDAVKDRARRVYLEERLREDRVIAGAKRPPWGT